MYARYVLPSVIASNLKSNLGIQNMRAGNHPVLLLSIPEDVNKYLEVVQLTSTKPHVAGMKWESWEANGIDLPGYFCLHPAGVLRGNLLPILKLKPSNAYYGLATHQLNPEQLEAIRLKLMPYRSRRVRQLQRQQQRKQRSEASTSQLDEPHSSKRNPQAESPRYVLSSSTPAELGYHTNSKLQCCCDDIRS
jgi:hypothetical protein